MHSLTCVSLLVGWSAVLAYAGSPGGDDPSRVPNRLADASSPYLLQHKYNPVDWYPWGEEAFERAKKEDKPVFLSIGYAACHWCHVMAHESFEDDAVAAILNESFISIKLDREERPDIDEIYMAATVAQTGRGGWPMSVFMTPDQRPFFCGTYFPPEARHGRQGFKELCTRIADQWKSNRGQLLTDAESLVGRVRARKQTRAGQLLDDRNQVSSHVDRLVQSFDTRLGGRRSNGNKFPPTMELELILREYATHSETSRPDLLLPVEVTLKQMGNGGIYDHIAGGICRYSTDPRWFAPHFEKMLYDQATVSGVYLSAFQLLKDPFYERMARGILDYCIADLQAPEGGFYSSRDADSEGEEGKFYIWTHSELMQLLGEADGRLFCDYFNVRKRGNWHHGQNILYIKQTDEAFAARHGLSASAWRDKLNELREKVHQRRATRIHPGLDDKVLVEWNGLLITSLARAYRIFNAPHYREAATKAADFILNEMVRDGRLLRAHRRGKSYTMANTSDYANFVEALITLFETTGDRRWLDQASRLHESFVDRFRDPAQGGFFYTADDAEPLIVRSKNVRDGVVPSCNSTAALNCLRLSILLGAPSQKELAEETMRSMGRVLARGGLSRMQWAVLFYLDHPKEIAIIGDPNQPETQSLLRLVYDGYLPNKVVMLGSPEEAMQDDAPPLLKRKTLVRGKPGAYVCRNYLCGKPVNSPADLRKQLESR